jgi:hypothetical protein
VGLRLGALAALFDEAVPSPTRKVSGRLTVSYSGFEGESELLERLYKRAIAGEVVAPAAA